MIESIVYLLAYPSRKRIREILESFLKLTYWRKPYAKTN